MGIRHTESGDELFLDGNNFCDIFSPHVTTFPVSMNQNTTRDLIIDGKYFTTDVEVSFTNGIVLNSLTVISPTKLILNITSPATDTYHDMTIRCTVCEATFNDFIRTELIVWIDLSSNSNATYPDVLNGMVVGQDASGMYFTGASPWSSWVKFNSHSWDRTAVKTLQWIFSRPDGAMMIGIGSTGTNEASTAQYQEAEVEVYFSSSTSIWGLYGNNGNPGTAGNMASSSSIVGGSGIYKLVFEQNGNNGANVLLYEIPSASPSDWDDVSTLLTTMTVGGTLNPSQPTIMPFILPRSGGSQRFIAYKVGA